MEELGELFAKYEFGKKILKGEEVIREVLKNPVFIHNGGVDPMDVLNLAILYAKGTTREKVDAMFVTFDESTTKE